MVGRLKPIGRREAAIGYRREAKGEDNFEIGISKA